jgi:proteic killer suppression protein
MELAFRTRRLRTLCEDHDEAVRTMGEAAAEALRTRIADLRAVTYLAELPAGRPAVFEGERPELHFELRAGWSLLMTVGHQDVPRTEEGDLDHTRVRRARVQEINHE